MDNHDNLVLIGDSTSADVWPGTEDELRLGAAEAARLADPRPGADPLDAVLAAEADAASGAVQDLTPQLLRATLNRLPVLERLVLRLRFGIDGQQASVDEVARYLHISKSTAHTLETRALTMLRSRCERRLDVAA
jgi:DNA-directed RNA polymerase sigma subunit (sigma70/sigma32)